jgi:hypothetical protein
MKEFELPQTKLKGDDNDRAPSMSEKNRSLMGRIRREIDKQNPE